MTGRALRIATVLAGLCLVYGLATFLQVWWTAHQDRARPADAIVVLGAAQYDGRPSPVLRARLDHAADLYRRDVAPLVVVTGGAREGDRHTEASASATYLHGQGVPGTAVERETTGGSSYESLAATARFLRDRDVGRVVLVSDGFHALRIASIADEVGLDAVVSPTPDSAIDGADHWAHLVRETTGVAVGRLVGYRRLDAAVGGSQAVERSDGGAASG